MTSTDLTIVEQPAATSVALFDPGRLEQMFRLAEIMASSSLLPEHMTHGGPANNRQPLPPDRVRANALMVVDLAMGMQVSPFIVAQHVAQVHGRLCVEGKLVAAMLEARLGVRLKYTISGAGKAMHIVVSGTLPGDTGPVEIEGTVEQWHRGEKSPWAAPANWPRQLRYRGAREWARAYAPHILLGIYTPDEMEGSDTPRTLTPAGTPPDIPEPPVPAIAAPTLPPIPDVPDVPQRTDADYLAAVDTDLAACASVDDLMEVIEANKAETDARGLQQEISDRVGRHRVRIHDAAKAAARPKPAAQQAAEEAYVQIARAIQAAGTMDDLAAAWKAAGAGIKMLPGEWQAALTADKDRRKAELQSQPQGAAA